MMSPALIIVVGLSIFCIAPASSSALAADLKDDGPSRERYVGISIVGGSGADPAIAIGGGKYSPGGARHPVADRERYPERDRYPNGDRDRYPGNRPGGDRDQYPGGHPGGDHYPDHPGPGSGDRDRHPDHDYITFFEQPYFRGWSFNAKLSRQCRNLENDYGSYNNGISSIKTHGNCVVVFTRYDCRGKEYIIRPRFGNAAKQYGQNRYRPPIGHSELAEDLNNSISSYRRC